VGVSKENQARVGCPELRERVLSMLQLLTEIDMTREVYRSSL
jgi:hypothetical protein